MRIAVLGAGGGGVSAAVELTKAGHDVCLWNRSAETLEPYRQSKGIRYRGVLGDGRCQPEGMTDDLPEALDGADGILVCLPTIAHVGLAESLAALGVNALPVVLNPGHTGGALAFRRVFELAGLDPPAVTEFSTLTYVARKTAPDTVSVTGKAGRIRAAVLPGDESSLRFSQQLYPAAEAAANLLATSLANVNMVLHPPGAILGASWVEATGGDFTFYVQGLSPGVGRVMEALDRERLSVAAAFALDLPDLFDEMRGIGTIDAGAARTEGIAAAVRSGRANSRIRAPDSLAHRYYVEDFFFGLRPFLALAAIAETGVPVARSLMTLGECMLDPDGRIEGRSARAMGIADLDRTGLLARVNGSS